MRPGPHNTHRRMLPTAALPVCVALAAACPAWAQTSLGSMQGSVVDAQGLPVAHASVIVRNTDLGSTREFVSAANGSFRVEGLVSGAYTVEARGQGLATRRPLHLTLTLGSTQQLSLRLDPLAVHESTRVTGRGATVEGNTTAPAPNTTEASLNTFLPGLTVTYLPNRDRNFAQFTSLTAGAQQDSDETGVILNGQRSEYLLTEVDGVSFSSPLFGGQRGAEDRGDFVPLTAVREFEVVRSGVDAAAGRSTAGLINVVTKSGANRPRGEAFYTGRPAGFTAADAFGRSLGSVQNAFGGSYGGPLRRDQVFYFVSVEKDFLQSPFQSAFDPQAPGTEIPSVLSAQQGEIFQRHAPLAGFGRLDMNLNSRNTATFALGLDRIRSTDVGDGLSRTMGTAAYASSFSGQSMTTRASLSSALGGNLFNNAVIAWSSDHRNLRPNSTAPEQFVNGFGLLGGSAAGQHLYTGQRTELRDDLTVTRGRNALTLGGDLAVEPSYEQKELNTDGRFDYDSLADLLNNNARRFQQTFPTGDTRYRGTVHQLSLYADARVTLRPSLYLTAGLRWDAQWNPQPPLPNAALAVTQQIPNDLHQVQPRLGLAWNPDSGTVVRLSSGLYAAATPATFFHRVFSDGGTQTITVDSYFDPLLLTLSGASTGSVHALGAPPAGLTMLHAEVAGIAASFRNPTSAQVAASIDRQLLPKLEVTLGYLRNSTWALERRLDDNLAPPVGTTGDGTPLFTAPRPLAGFGRVLVEHSDVHSTYDGLSLSANAPISRRSQLLVNYTLSRTRDDDTSASPYSPVTALNPFAPGRENGFSDGDARHSLNLNAIFNLPAGFKLNPLLVARSGLPYTPIVGFDRQGDANDENDRAILNGSVAPRNVLRQPAFGDLDLRVVKDFTLKGEGHHLDLFADVFNVAGFGNRRFAPDALNLFGDSQHPVFSAGQPLFAPGVAEFGGPRTLQLTARLVGF